MTAGCMYRITSPTGKAYIGITSKTACQRFRAHVKESIRGSRCAIHLAISSHGAECMTVETLAIGDWAYLKELEVRAIAAYGTRSPCGYNLTDGGDGVAGYKPTAETLARKSGSLKGRAVSEATREKIRLALTGRKHDSARIEKNRLCRIGAKHTPESRQKMSKNLRGVPKSSAHAQKLAEVCRMMTQMRRASAARHK